LDQITVNTPDSENSEFYRNRAINNSVAFEFEDDQ